MLRQKKGFTLIEMLVVILIIVILITIAVPAIAGYRENAQHTADVAALETVHKALEAAMIQTESSDYGEGYLHSRTNHSYESLSTYTDTANPGKEEFYHLIADYLGANFEGYFKFLLSNNNTDVLMISYWESMSATSDESVMFYHTSVTATRTPMYLDDAIADTVWKTDEVTYFRPKL